MGNRVRTSVGRTGHTHRQVESAVEAECRLLGGEGLACTEDVRLVACARLLVADVAQRLFAAQCCEVGLAHRQEVGRQVARNHLARVDKYVHCEQAKRVDPWGEEVKIL